MKMTEREILTNLANEEVIVNNPVYKEFILKKLAKVTPKPDELTEKIVEALKTLEGFSTLKNILAEINDPKVTIPMLVPRLTALVKEGRVEKVLATLADKSKVMTYGIIEK